MERNRFNIIKFIFICLHAISHAQTIPSIGHSDDLEIGTWNLEWFGKTEPGYGPKNDSLQQSEISKVLQLSKVDVWILTEIADSNALNKYLDNSNIYGHYYSSYFQEQKTAVIFDKKTFRIISGKLLGTNNKDSFSTGRFPIEVALVSIKQDFPDTIFVIGVHLKSNIGNESQKMLAYNSRKRSSEWLHDYLKKNHSNHHCVVAGDWNDDIDLSIYNELPTPFSKLLSGNLPFTFISKKLSEKKISSTTSYTETIDHILSSNILANYCEIDSVFVWRLDKHISQYSDNCSDHYPVVSRFNFRKTQSARLYANRNFIFQNPCNDRINLSTLPDSTSFILYDFQGRMIKFGNKERDGFIDFSSLETGHYILRICIDGACYDHKVIFENK